MFTEGYQNVANLVGLFSQLKGDNMLNQAHLWTERQEKCLLVLDNADDTRVFQRPIGQGGPSRELFKFLPRGPYGLIL